MRLCNAFIHYFLASILTLFICNCYSHEHHNHVDPVSTKYSQSAATIDPLSKNIETANVQKYNDDEHVHDTIEARLRTKHDLRQSVHQHSDNDDDKHENEEDYINRLNSALENDYETEHHFQYAVPPIEDLDNNTLLQNQTKEAVQIPANKQNQTVSSPSTSIQTPIEQKLHTNDGLSSTEIPGIVDTQQYVQKPTEKLNSKIILDDIIPSIQVQTNEQQSADILQQNIIKETMTTTQPQQGEPHNVVKPTSDQQQTIPNTIINETSQDNSSLDIKPSSPKPVEVDPSQQIKSETIQDVNSLNENSSPPTPIESDEEQQIPETIQDTSSIAPDTHLAQEDQQPPLHVINTLETVKIDTKLDDNSSVAKESPTLDQTTPPKTSRILRSATSRLHQKAQARHRHSLSSQEPIKTQQEPENIPSTESTTIESTIAPPIDQSIELSSLTPGVETAEQPPIDLDITNENQTLNNDQNIQPIDTTDLPRQVHVHDPNIIVNELNKNENPSLDQEIENNATVASFLINDHSPHLPRILENQETTSTIDSTLENNDETNQNLTPIDSKIEETNTSSASKSNNSDKILPIEYRQICWRLPKPVEPSLELIENQILRFTNLLPEFIRTIFFERIDDRETLMNTVWFGSICSTCFLFSFLFLSMGTKRLKQSKNDKEIRSRCQQLQQYNNQIELERATFERQNQKLSDEIDELKNLPIRDADEEVFELHEKYERLQVESKISRTEHDALLKDIDHQQHLIQKYEFDMQKQVETVAYLNDENLRQKQELEKEREKLAQLQSNDLSLERFEKLQGIIQELKSEISQLKQEKFDQIDQLQQIQQHANQLDVDNNQLTIKMKQLKDLLEQRDETITRIRQKMLNDNQDEEQSTEISDFEETSDNNPNELLSNIDNDVEKANQHMRDLHSEIDEKTRRIKELDCLLNQEKDHCRELETKLKVVLELRERDAHLHIRQLGQTDAELRKARTDTERVRILQQQLQLKQQQFDDVQKVLTSEQTKFSEECSKLQHETHEKWMEVKRLTRELDGARKECEGLRRQISKYGNSERSSQEKTMHKPVAKHLNNSDRLSNDPETNGNSPPLIPYQQGDNFRPIDHERNDSGAASPSEMFRIRPPLFGMHRPPFFPPPFMPPPPNPFMMGARFPMPVGGLHGMISPIPHLITNGSGGSDSNSFEIVDPSNITPNSSSYDIQLNGSAASPEPNSEQQTSAKVKKPKKSLKKKTKTSATTIASGTKEDV